MRSTRRRALKGIELTLGQKQQVNDSIKVAPANGENNTCFCYVISKLQLQLVYDLSPPV